MKRSKIICKIFFNYLVFVISLEKLKDFKNCDNCREFFYKGKIYRNGEIESIYLLIEKVFKKSIIYVNFVFVKDSEILVGKIMGRVGDYGIL